MSTSEMILQLTKRGVALSEPDALAKQELEELLTAPMDAFFSDLYRSFGGFLMPDENLLSLWSPSRIKLELSYAKEISGFTYYPVGDVLLDSDLILVCLEDSSAPAYLFFEEKKVSPSGKTIIKDIACGDFVL